MTDLRTWLARIGAAVAEVAQVALRGRDDRLGLEALVPLPCRSDPRATEARTCAGGQSREALRDGLTGPNQYLPPVPLRGDMTRRLHRAPRAQMTCGGVPVPSRSPALLPTPRLLFARRKWRRPAPGTRGDAVGRKRGLPPLSIDPTTTDVTAIHRSAAGRASEGAGSLATGAGSG